MVELAKGMEIFFIQTEVDDSAVKMGAIEKLFNDQVLIKSVSHGEEFEYLLPWNELNNTLFLSFYLAIDVLRQKLNQNVETITIRYIRSPSRNRMTRYSDISISKIGDIVTIIQKGFEKTGTVVGFRCDVERGVLQMGVEVDEDLGEQAKSVVALKDDSHTLPEDVGYYE